MQSTGQACTHSSSLVQVSVITYAIFARGCNSGATTQIRVNKSLISTIAHIGWGNPRSCETVHWAVMKIETRAVHAGRRIDPATAAVTPPIHLSTTFERTAEGEYPL